MIGVYYLPITFIAHETGIEFNEVITTLQKLSEINYCSYDDKFEYIWVHDMAYEQLGVELKENDNRVKGFHEAFQTLPNLPFIQAFIEKYKESFYLDKQKSKHLPTLEGPSKPLQSKEKENDKNKQNENNNNNEVIDYKNLKNNFNCLIDGDEDDLENLTVEEQAIEVIKYFNAQMGTSQMSKQKNFS